MHVFVTGATGWIGSAVVEELIRAGHQVSGLSRSDDKSAKLASTGAVVVEGRLEDLDVLISAAGKADAVIHTAFNHDFSKFAENAEQDRQVIGALGKELEGSDRPLIVTSGLSGLPRGAVETDLPSPLSLRKSEQTARSLRAQGIRAATVRLAPSVHGQGDHGFIPILARLARASGVSAYLGDGGNCWSGVHRLDAARVYRLALETGVSEEVYQAVADVSVPFKQIAEALGQALGLPVESRTQGHFGWFGNMAGAEMAAWNARTREVLEWTPEGPSLIAEISQPEYHTV